MSRDDKEKCRTITIHCVFQLDKRFFAVIADDPIRIIPISEIIFKFLKELGVCECDICDRDKKA